MKQVDFDIKKRKIWAKWERYYHMVFPDDFMEFVEKALEIGNLKDESDLEDLDYFVPRYTEGALIFHNSRSGISSNNKIKPEKRRRKHFNRRFYLIKFVIDCWEHEKRSYIPWKYITAEWNKAHPSDQIDKAVLKAEYYRSLREKDIVIPLLAIKKWNNNDTFQLFLERLRKHYNVDPNTLKIFNETWLHLLMAKDDKPMREFLKQIKWQKAKDIAELKTKLNITEARNER